ncbi:MAG: 3-hydroxyacyl-CoA dehydrogenase family protein, partial [Anaerolineae bacterium]
ECPGFLFIRILIPYLFEAVVWLVEGAATAAEIDERMTAFGWPMGPFTLMDMLGLDICYDVGIYLYQEYGSRMEPAKLFAKLVQAGRLGEKAGAGFYGYGDQTDEPVKQFIKELQESGEVRTDTEFSEERLMMPMINEAILCVTEHVASVNDIDMAMIAGTGMTYHGERMGPLQLADTLGLDHVLQKLEEFTAKYGERFRPARLLRTKVRAKHLGKKVGKGFLEYA